MRHDDNRMKIIRAEAYCNLLRSDAKVADDKSFQELCIRKLRETEREILKLKDKIAVEDLKQKEKKERRVRKTNKEWD